MINVALFGYGRIGQMHAMNISNHKDFKLLYVFDKNLNLALTSKRKFRNKVIANYKIALKDKAVDVIFIASTTSTHVKFIEEAILHSKIVFCEKPLDLNLDKVKRLLRKISSRKNKIQLGFNRRFDPGHNDLKKYLEKNLIGKLEKIIITSRDPAPPSMNYLKSSGGIFKDMMIHDFDLCRYYLKNDEITEICSSASSFTNFYKRIRDHELASVTMKTNKGVLCIISNSRHSSYGYDQRVELFGSKGMIISGNQTKNQTEIYNSSSTKSKKPYLNFFIERYKDSYKNQLNELYALVKKNKKPRSVFYDGYKALQIAESAIKSLRFKKTIKIR